MKSCAQCHGKDGTGDAPVNLSGDLKNEDGTPRYTVARMTGMFISMMFAGHHTTSGTAAWTLIEMLRHPHQ